MMHTVARTPFRAGRRLCIIACLVAGAVRCADIPAAPANGGPLILTVADTATADRATLVLVTATIDPTLSRDKRQVVFTTTGGSFTQPTASTITVQADSLGVARTYLTPPADSTLAFITASSSNATRTAPIAFKRARADAITVVADSFSIDTTRASSMNVSAKLRRALGLPSPALQVTFSAARADGTPIGQFSAPTAVTDSNGTVSSRFTIGGASYHGAVTITATTVGPDGGNVPATTTITVR
jgi:hypothetical protein